MAPLVYVQDLSMNGTMWNDFRMGEGCGSFLLSHGDKLKLTPDIYLIFQCEEYKESQGFDILQKVEMKVGICVWLVSTCVLIWIQGLPGSVRYHTAQTRFRGVRKGPYGIQQG